MEQIANVDKLTDQIDESSNSPPQKRAKHQPDENLQQLKTISSNIDTSDDHLIGADRLTNQHSTNSNDIATQQPSKNGIFNFIAPSEEDCAWTPEENLERNSALLKNSQTRGVWHKSLGESHAVRIRERLLFGHIMCPEETRKKILELDIFRILESEEDTEIGALYKVSPSKFVLFFTPKTAKEKLEGTEIQCRFGDSEICLSFRKRVGPLRNGREAIFVTIFLPEFINDQAVRLPFSNFGDVVCL